MFINLQSFNSYIHKPEYLKRLGLPILYIGIPICDWGMLRDKYTCIVGL